MYVYKYIIFHWYIRVSNEGQVGHDRQISYLDLEDPIKSAGSKYVYQVTHHTSDSQLEIHSHVKHTNNARESVACKNNWQARNYSLWWLHCFTYTRTNICISKSISIYIYLYLSISIYLYIYISPPKGTEKDPLTPALCPPQGPVLQAIWTQE